MKSATKFRHLIGAARVRDHHVYHLPNM